jgi:hypothetical protein
MSNPEKITYRVSSTLQEPCNVRVKLVKSDVNRGYTGGMNLGREARDLLAKACVGSNLSTRD